MVGDVVQRLPLRGRLTLAFAIVMIVLFGGLALLLHTRFSASLDDGTRRALSTRAFDLSTLVLRDNAGRRGSPAPLPERGGAFAQILDARGRILDATPGHGTRPLLTADEIRTVCDATSKPVNVLARRNITAAEIFGAGARRISLGGALAFTAVHGMARAAAEIRDRGQFGSLSVPPELGEWLAD